MYNNELNYIANFGRDQHNSSRRILEVIDLSDNQLESDILESSFFQFIGSKKLHLKNNKIKYFDKIWSFFDKTLKFLDLKHNEIEVLHVSIISFQNLKSLFLQIIE